MSIQKEYFSLKYYVVGEEDKIPSVLDAYLLKKTDLSDVNRILELHNIKRFFETHDSVKDWSSEKYDHYLNLARESKSVVVGFFCSLSADKLISVYDCCDVVFWDDFWMLFYQFRVYERIPKDTFAKTMNEMQVSPERLLSNRDFVCFFDEEVSEMLCNPSFGARFIVDYYLSNRTDKTKYYLPSSLTKEDKYNTIKEYIDGADVNSNILYLIFNGKSRDPKEFMPDDRLRYLAKKRYEKFWGDESLPIIKSGYAISVTFAPDNPDKSLEISDGKIIAKYNSNWIIENLDNPTLLNNFIHLFDYVDDHMQCSLTSESLRSGALENVFMVDGNGMYKPSQVFRVMNGLADIQMHSYAHILNEQNIYIEDLVKWFFEDYLNAEFSAKGFICLMPDHNDSLLSKYERVASVMDGITKQYKLFCEDRVVNRGLYEMSSGSILYESIPSQLKHKYAYSSSSDIDKEAQVFFSDQSLLSLTKKTEANYNTLFDLLMNEKIHMNDILECNLQTVEWLSERGSIHVENGFLSIEPERVSILRELYYKQVLCLNYIRSEIIKELISSGQLVEENTLLSRPESRYFNYLLNKRQFSDGLDLRNKYIHDTGSLDEKTQIHDYYVLLKALVVLVIKINEDFCLYDELSREGQDFYEI